MNGDDGFHRAEIFFLRLALLLLLLLGLIQVLTPKLKTAYADILGLPPAQARTAPE
ncbi:MAG TPA: hypothetical protein VGB98_06160 [Pyrinomonadaceae bacterium]|jgi:hypothetical protein